MALNFSELPAVGIEVRQVPLRPHGSAGADDRWILDGQHQRDIVDGLRALGIILVVAFHGAFVFAKLLDRQEFDAFVETMPAALNIVWQALGSEVVFFSSGFLLSYLLIRERVRRGAIDVRRFWLRRASRILPLFLVALGIFMIGRTFHLDRLLTNLLFCARVTGYFELTARGGKNFIPVGWSLEVMVHAYLLLPFLVMAVLRTRWPLTVAIVLAVASVAPRYFALAAEPVAYSTPAYEILDAGEVPQIHRDLYYLTWFRLTPFLVGLAAAVVVTRHRAALERLCGSRGRATALFAAGAVLVAASGFLPLQDRDSFVYRLFGPQQWLWFWSCQRAVLVVGVAMLLLAVLAARGGIPAVAGRFLARPVFRPISHGIYSIYLFHFAALIPAALIVLAPAVVRGIAASPSLDRKVVVEHIGAAVESVTVWQYLVMAILAVWLSTRLASFLTRTVEAPAQRWLRARTQRRESSLALVRSERADAPSREPRSD